MDTEEQAAPPLSREEFLRAARALDSTLDYRADPVAIVGDLATAEDVDEVRECIRADEEQADKLEERADKLIAKARRHRTRAGEIRGRVLEVLNATGRDQVRGTEVKFSARPSPWKVTVLRQPTAEDHLALGDLVKRTEAFLSWDLKALAAQLKRGFTCDFARLDRGRHLVTDEIGG